MAASWLWVEIVEPVYAQNNCFRHTRLARMSPLISFAFPVINIEGFSA
jgi:hypothetical protein